jgi:hypothetical protein
MLSIWTSALVISADRRAISARSRVIQSSQEERSLELPTYLARQKAKLEHLWAQFCG